MLKFYHVLVLFVSWLQMMASREAFLNMQLIENRPKVWVTLPTWLSLQAAIYIMQWGRQIHIPTSALVFMTFTQKKDAPAVQNKILIIQSHFLQCLNSSDNCTIIHFALTVQMSWLKSINQLMYTKDEKIRRLCLC